MKKIFLFSSLFLLAFVGFAQEKNEGNNHKDADSKLIKAEDGKVTVTVDGKEVDLEDFFEDLGDRIEASVEEASEHADDNVNIRINDEDININLDLSFAKTIEAFAETLADGIEEAVKNMNVELHDVDPDDLRDSDLNINDDRADELLEEIEARYDAKITHIDRMLIKIRDGYMVVEMDFDLDNGRHIEGFKEVLD